MDSIHLIEPDFTVKKSFFLLDKKIDNHHECRRFGRRCGLAGWRVGGFGGGGSLGEMALESKSSGILYSLYFS